MGQLGPTVQMAGQAEKEHILEETKDKDGEEGTAEELEEEGQEREAWGSEE